LTKDDDRHRLIINVRLCSSDDDSPGSTGTGTFGAGGTDNSRTAPAIPSHHRGCREHSFLKSKDPKLLSVMLIGLVEFDNVIEKEPFNGASPTLQKSFTPGLKEFKDEINRRAHYLAKENETKAVFQCTKGITPKPAQWKRPNCLEWLKDPLHVIATTEDNDFLRNTLAAYKVLVQSAIAEKSLAIVRDNSDFWTRQGFQGLEYKLRLIHSVSAFSRSRTSGSSRSVS
jgi:hypothetical protein